MLGRAWKALLDGSGLAGTTLSHTQLDLTDRGSIEAGVREGIDVVINCAAWTDVDSAETNEASATHLNGTAAGWLAERCRAANATLLHYSSDYVFNGRASAPYPTGHALDPVNAYGRGKARGERAIIESGCSHLIVRSSWLYAPWGKNFVRTIAQLARERATLKVVADQRGRPSSVEPLAAASLALESSGARGIFHVTDGGECSWYEFARTIAGRGQPPLPRYSLHIRPVCATGPCARAYSVSRPRRDRSAHWKTSIPGERNLRRVLTSLKT